MRILIHHGIHYLQMSNPVLCFIIDNFPSKSAVLRRRTCYSARATCIIYRHRSNRYGPHLSFAPNKLSSRRPVLPFAYPRPESPNSSHTHRRNLKPLAIIMPQKSGEQKLLDIHRARCHDADRGATREKQDREKKVSRPHFVPEHVVGGIVFNSMPHKICGK